MLLDENLQCETESFRAATPGLLSRCFVIVVERGWGFKCKKTWRFGFQSLFGGIERKHRRLEAFDGTFD